MQQNDYDVSNYDRFNNRCIKVRLKIAISDRAFCVNVHHRRARVVTSIFMIATKKIIVKH